MMSPQPIRGGGETSDGLGWGRRTGWEGDTMYWGNGRTPGSTCGLLVYPDRGVVVALLSNIKGAPIERGDLQAVSLRFRAELEGQPVAPPPDELDGSHVFEASMQGQTFDVSLDLRAQGDVPRGEVRLPFPGLEQSPVVDAFRWHGAVWILAVNRGFGILPLRLTPGDAGYEGRILRTEIVLRGPVPGSGG